MPAPPGSGQNSTDPGSLHARRRGQRPATGLRVRSAITPKIRRLGPVVGRFITPVSPRAVDRGGNRPGGWGQGRGLGPIGANLPHRCTAFRVGYRRGASSVEPPCRFWWTRGIPRLTQAVDRGGHRPGGWGPGRGRAPIGAGGGTRRSLLVAPTPPGLRPPPPPPQGAGAVRGDSPGQTLSGHDELLVRTGRTLADCPPTRITTVFRGGGRLTADWAILPQNSLRLLNWAVSSWISIPNVNAYGGLPPPHTSRTRGCLPVANPGISSWNIQVQCSSSSRNESVASSTRRVPDRGFPPVQQYPPHPPTRNAPPGRPRDLHWITPIR